MKRNDMVAENVPNVVTACCILHNMCEVHSETFDNAWLEEAERTTQLSQTIPLLTVMTQTLVPLKQSDMC